MDADIISSTFLCRAAQELCDVNSALRTRYELHADGTTTSRVLAARDFRLPTKLATAPEQLADAVRLAEQSEAEAFNLYESVPIRALVLAAQGGEKGLRHTLCLTIHHINADFVAMEALSKQLAEMLASQELSCRSPTLCFGDCAVWQREQWLAARDSVMSYWSELLADVVIDAPRVEEDLSLPGKRLFSLSSSQHERLCTVAQSLNTTFAILLHLAFACIAARLQPCSRRNDGSTVALVCNVVTGRERHVKRMRDVVGCIDTSVPVCIEVHGDDCLPVLIRRTSLALTDSLKHAALAPRGEFMCCLNRRADELFELVPHINVTRDSPACEHFRRHHVQHVEKTRWGLLLRAHISSTGCVDLTALSENKQVASLTSFALPQLLHRLATDGAGTCRPLAEVDAVLDCARLAVRQLAATQEASNQPAPPAAGGDSAFIWSKLMSRQHRWFEHTKAGLVKRDEQNRFVPTSLFPFPFAQLDKLAERRFIDSLGVRQAKLLFVLTAPEELLAIAPQLPSSWVVKPVGAGHSDGVFTVRNGVCGSVQGFSGALDLKLIVSELLELRRAGGSWHNGKFFAWNVSKFLVEELVVDEVGESPPTDYKMFMLGGRLLWCWIMFRNDTQLWAAFVDSDFALLPSALDPATLWRTSSALVCTEVNQMPPRPPCWSEIVQQAKCLGEKLRIFARLDFYADATHGPLLGEVTLFPLMLQPRSIYSGWANALVSQHWEPPDGCVAPVVAQATAEKSVMNMDLLSASFITRQSKSDVAARSLSPPAPQLSETVLELIPDSADPWCIPLAGNSRVGPLSFAELRAQVDAFDLGPWSISHNDPVAILLSNGPHLAACLLATMHRYCAVPLDARSPVDALRESVLKSRARVVITMHGSSEAAKASSFGSAAGIRILELHPSSCSVGASSLPASPQSCGCGAGRRSRVPTRLGDCVLRLQTSGTSGTSKTVSFSWKRLQVASLSIAASLGLRADDTGLNMLPLHHVGGICCNLVAPLCKGSSMMFLAGFDATLFSSAAAISWCYAVPVMWAELLAHATMSKLVSDRWPRLRLLRSASSDLPHALARDLARLFGPDVSVMPTYGMTEAMPIASPPLGYALQKPGTVGPPVSACEVRIVSPIDFSVLAAGDVGEITVRGGGVFAGYEDIDSVALFTASGFFRTGDIGYLDEEGWLFVTGRIKEAINCGGETVSPAEVEEVLCAHPNVLEAMAFAAPHVSLHEVVAVALPQDSAIDLAELRAWAKARLPHAKLPHVMVLVKHLPRTSSGKLRRGDYAKRLQMLPLSRHETRVYIACVDGEAAQLLMSSLANAHPAPKEDNAKTTFSFETVGMSARARHVHVEDAVLKTVCGLVNTATALLTVETPLLDAGIDSLSAIELTSRLGSLYGVALASTVVFDHPTARAVAAHLLEQVGPCVQQESSLAVPVSMPRPAFQACDGLVSITLAAMTGRWPSGCSNEYVRHGLRASCGDAVGSVPRRRWVLDQVVDVCTLTASQKACVRHGGFVGGAQRFDSHAFGISPAEAGAMDPQQRLLLELGYTSMHGASSRRSMLMGSDTSVFLGIARPDWALAQPAVTRSSIYGVTGDNVAVAAGRVSFALGLQGPCLSVDTACSSSLTAVHSGALAVKGGESGMGLALAVSLKLVPHATLGAANAGMLSFDGRCKTLDVHANGYVRSEGINGLVLLSGKGTIAHCGSTMQDDQSTSLTAPNGHAQSEVVTWLRRGNHGATLLLGHSVRQDGRSASLTAPNGSAQRTLLLAARGPVAPILRCIEAHGTGTALGDPTEVGALVSVFAATVHTTPLFVGGTKGSVGHTEASSGLVGLLQGQQMLGGSVASGNAQLRALNPLVGARLGGSVSNGFLLLTQGNASREACGVSSFGYSGTIGHVVLGTHAPHVVVPALRCSCAYRRRAYWWREAAGTDATRTGTYAVCWAPLSRANLSSQRRLLLMRRSSTLLELPSPGSVSHIAVVMLEGGDTAMASLHGAYLALALAQQVIERHPLPFLLVLTGGAMVSINCAHAASDAGHGGAWGLARVLRLEHPALHTQSADAPRGTRGAALHAMIARTTETEVLLACGAGMGARLRACARTAHRPGLTHGTYAITGGLGGLGLRAAVLLVESGASQVLLGSRSGRVVRDGQGLDARLASLSVVACLVQSDVGDAIDTVVLMPHAMVVSVLHAAGTSRKGLVAELSLQTVRFTCSSKALAAQHLRGTTCTGLLDAQVCFSSVASGLGNVGQASYAASNAWLDAQALCCRSFGRAARSMQWPLVGGAGMGAETFAALAARRMTIVGMTGIALEEYSSCLGRYLAGSSSTLLSVQLVHRLDAQELLHDIEDRSQTRFSELSSSVKAPVVCSCACLAARARDAGSVLDQSLEPLTTLQRRAHVVTAVLRIVRELTGEAADSLTEETPLMDAGVDSLAATELSSRLRSVTGVALSPTLVFDQPTPRAIVAHLLEQVTDAASAGGAPLPAACMAGAGASLALVSMVARWAGGCSGEGTCWALQAGSGDAVGSVPRRRWVLDQVVDVCTLTASQKACVRHGGFVGGAQRFDSHAFGISPAEAGAMDPQQRLLLELGYTSMHGASSRRSMLMGSDTSVFLGIARPDWALAQPAVTRSSIYGVTGDNVAVAAGRVSFALGLQGPCLSVDTACSSSLTAVHSGALAVKGGESGMGLALAVSLKLVPHATLGAANAGMLSFDGRCKTLDVHANGYVRSESTGSLALQSSDGALVMSGSAIRQDGRSASLTAPNGSAQRMLLRAACVGAKVVAADLGLVEAHGTGTALGDPTEVGALAAVHGRNVRSSLLAVGTAKASVGHSEAAAGQVGLLRGRHALMAKAASASAQLRSLNPLVRKQLGLSSDQFVLPTQGTGCKLARSCGVSSFGFSGTIGHALLALAPETVIWRDRIETLVNRRRAFEWQYATGTQSTKWSATSHCYTFAWSNLGDDDAGRSVRLHTAKAASVRNAACISPRSSYDAEICLIGAGTIGLMVARDAASCGFSSVILEKEPLIGGVWAKNDYPGLRLQGSSASYRCFSLAPKWTYEGIGKSDASYRATSMEVLNYIHEMAAHQLIDVSTSTAYINHSGGKGTFFVRSSRGTIVTCALVFAPGIHETTAGKPHWPIGPSQITNGACIMHSSDFHDFKAQFHSACVKFVVGASKAAVDILKGLLPDDKKIVWAHRGHIIYHNLNYVQAIVKRDRSITHKDLEHVRTGNLYLKNQQFAAAFDGMLKRGNGIAVGEPLVGQPAMRGGFETEVSIEYLRQFLPYQLIILSLRCEGGALQVCCKDGRVLAVGPDDAAVLCTGQRVEGAGEGSYARRAEYNKDGLVHVAPFSDQSATNALYMLHCVISYLTGTPSAYNDGQIAVAFERQAQHMAKVKDRGAWARFWANMGGVEYDIAPLIYDPTKCLSLGRHYRWVEEWYGKSVDVMQAFSLLQTVYSPVPMPSTAGAPRNAAALTKISLEAVLEMARRTADDALDADTPLMESGVDSLGAVELRIQLQRVVGEGVDLSSTLMFDHPTVRSVALHLQGSRPATAPIRVASLRTSQRTKAFLFPTNLHSDFVSTCLVYLSRSSHGAPLFGIPNGIGHAQAYGALSSVISNPIYSLLHPKLHPGTQCSPHDQIKDFASPYDKLEDLALLWASNIGKECLSTKARDNYHLVGASIGGLIAHLVMMVAHRRHSYGPSTITLIDPAPPIAPKVRPTAHQSQEELSAAMYVALHSVGAHDVDFLLSEDVLEEDLAVILAVKRAELGRVEWTMAAVQEQRKELRAATVLLGLVSDFDVRPWLPKSLEPCSSVFLVLASEREAFLVTSGRTPIQSSSDRARLYSPGQQCSAELLMRGSHIDVCERCMLGADESFNAQLRLVLQAW